MGANWDRAEWWMKVVILVVLLGLGLLAGAGCEVDTPIGKFDCQMWQDAPGSKLLVPHCRAIK